MSVSVTAALDLLSTGCAPCAALRAESEARGRAVAASDAARWAAAPAAERAPWAGVIGLEGTVTGDGRLIEPGALRWEDLPIPLRSVTFDVGAHDGAVVVGWINTIERQPGGRLWATGDFDLGSEEGREAHRLAVAELQNGVSMDLDDVTFEVRVAADVIDALDGDVDLTALMPQADGTVIAETVTPTDELRVTTDGRVRAATLVAIPAFAEAKIAALAAQETTMAVRRTTPVMTSVTAADEPPAPGNPTQAQVPDGLPLAGQWLNTPTAALAGAVGEMQYAATGMPALGPTVAALAVRATALPWTDFYGPAAATLSVGSVKTVGERTMSSHQLWLGNRDGTESGWSVDASETTRFAADSGRMDAYRVEGVTFEVATAFAKDAADALGGVKDGYQQFAADGATPIPPALDVTDLPVPVGYGAQSGAYAHATWLLRLADGNDFLDSAYLAFSQAALDEATLAFASGEDAMKDLVVTLGIFLGVDWGTDPQTRTTSSGGGGVEVVEDAGFLEDLPLLADEVLTASGIPVAPPAAWFADPHLSGPTPLTVTPEGRVYGHMALWGTCHATHTGRGQCIAPPHSPSNYAHYRLGSVLTAEGTEVATGKITMDTRHAGERMTASAAVAHYENTGAVVADVAAGEDQHGVWFAGALRPGVTPAQIRALRAAPLSGDWRRHGTDLELVAALAVNVPGFPVPRPHGLVAGGRVMSMVASGMLAPVEEPVSLTAADVAYLRGVAARQRAADEREAARAAARLAARAHARRNAAKVRAFAARRAHTA